MLSNNGTSVQISLDGSNSRMHDSFKRVNGIFDKALNAIRMCLENDIDTSISMTVTKVNFEDIPRVSDLARELGVSTFKLRRFMSEGRGACNIGLLDLGTEEIRRLLEFYWQKKEEIKNEIDIVIDQAPFAVVLDTEKIVKYQDTMKNRICSGCSAEISICVIGSDGAVTPCPSLSLEVGNIRSSSLNDIWKYSNAMTALRNRDLLSGQCGVLQFQEYLWWLQGKCICSNW